MTPKATLQPRAPMSIARTSARPGVATEREPVNVSTMMSPNRTSETRSIGSSTGFVERWTRTSVAVCNVGHSVNEVLRPLVQLMHELARVREGPHEAEGDVLRDLPVHVPVH